MNDLQKKIGVKTRLLQILNDYERGHKLNFSKNVGASSGNVQAWFDLSNPTLPNFNSLRKISKAYGVDLNWLLMGITEECHELQGLPLVERNGIKFVDSRAIAELLDIDHQNLIASIYKYQNDVERNFGICLFETEILKGPGKPPKFALLTEDQTLFIGTLSRNTTRVLEFKARLVKAFQNARKGIPSSFQPSLIQPSIAAFIMPKTFSEALRALAVEVESREAVEGKLDSIRKILEIN